VNHDEAADDETLAYFNAVDASMDVDGVSAEDGEGAHVDVIEDSQVEGATEDSSKKFRHDHRSEAIVSDKEGEGSHCREDDFVSPS